MNPRNFRNLTKTPNIKRLQISLMCGVFKWLLTSKVNYTFDHCQIICFPPYLCVEFRVWDISFLSLLFHSRVKRRLDFKCY